VFSQESCEKLLRYLENFSKNNADNIRAYGDNWHYWATSHGTNFDSFLFQNLNGLPDNVLIKSFYRKLYDIYADLGEETYYKDFDYECGISENSVKTINPLVFWYKAALSRFGWHKHPAENQKFQLLCNLTKPGVDYSGGETFVYMGEGTPDPEKMDDCEVFDSIFEQGDVFSFPYHRWHKVNPVLKGTGGWESRVSLLMPLSKREGGALNEYIDEME